MGKHCGAWMGECMREDAWVAGEAQHECNEMQRGSIGAGDLSMQLVIFPASSLVHSVKPAGGSHIAAM